MFQTNDLVMYGVHGVCCIQGTGPVRFSAGSPVKDYYKLKPVYEPTSTIIYVPVDHPSLMRNIMSPQQARQSLEELPQLAAPVVDIKNAKLLSAQYTEILHTYDWDKLLKLVKSIHTKSHQLAGHHKLGATDQKFYAKAQSLLCEELAAALDSTPNEMQKQLEARLALCS